MATFAAVPQSQVLTHKATKDETFWQQKWSQGETGWRGDERDASSAAMFERNAKWILAELQARTGILSPRMDTLREAFAGSTVFIPMCGDSPVLSFWAKKLGCKVIGIDIIGDSLRRAISEQFGDRDLGELPADANGIACFELPARERGEGDVLLLQGDVFSLLKNAVAYLEHVDIIYDRAALVAIDPAKRGQYIDLLRNLLNVRKSDNSLNDELFNFNGRRTHKVMFLNTVERPFDESGVEFVPSGVSHGPPFHMGEDEVLQAFTTALGDTTRYVTPVGNNRELFDSKKKQDFVDAFYVITAHANDHLKTKLGTMARNIDG